MDYGYERRVFEEPTLEELELELDDLAVWTKLTELLVIKGLVNRLRAAT